MSCNCNNNCHEQWCPQYLQAVTTPCDEPGCDQQLTTDCVIYTGPDLPCLGLTTGMQLTEILLNILYELHPECNPNTTTSTTTTSTTTTTVEPLALKLQFIDYVPVVDPSDVNDWNTYFQLPLHGNPFTSVTVISPTEYWLYGGSNIALPYEPFGDYDLLISVIDEAGSIVTLMDGCLEYNYELVEVDFPACTYIGNDVFSGCEALATINIPNVVYAGNNAFTDTAVTSLYLPLLTYAGNSCFSACVNITDFDLPNLLYAGDYLFYGCSSLVTYNVPKLTWDTDTSLPDGLFSGCSSITSFNFANLIFAGTDLFADCTSAIINTPSLVVVGDSSFRGCLAMTSFNLPNVTSVGASAFYDCTNSTSFDLPLATTIGDNAFHNCTAATSFDLSSCISLGSTVNLNDYVFFNITGNTITLTVPSALMTVDSGNPDADIQILQASNTVTVVTV